jgi:hypothetical protein
MTTADAGRSGLRPIERRVLSLTEDGVGHVEIAHRFRRSPEFIERVIHLAHLPGREARAEPHGLRPIERCIVKRLGGGETPADLGRRFRKSARSIERIDALARYKLASG